jgi:uncharacterized protein
MPDKISPADIFDTVRDAEGGPIQPVRLKDDDEFQFRCHKGVACWNRCCHGADITLTPGDILRLANHVNLRPNEFLSRFTLPAVHEGANMPVAKLRMEGEDGKGACMFLHDEDGCAVYEDRPATCRYYPLGLASVKMTEAEEVSDFSFMVKEVHCLGHDEDQTQTVQNFRNEQGVEWYDQVNRGWFDILMKLASWQSVGGPNGNELKPAFKKMFFMVSTDVDAYRRFVFETKFLQTYAIDDAAIELVRKDDPSLLQLGFDWLNTIIFNEPTLPMREQVLKEAIAKAREDMGAT